MYMNVYMIVRHQMIVEPHYNHRILIREKKTYNFLFILVCLACVLDECLISMIMHNSSLNKKNYIV